MPPSGLTLTEFWYYYVGPTLGYISPILDNDRLYSAALFSHGSLEFEYFEHAKVSLFVNDGGYVTRKIMYLTSCIHFLQS